MIRRLPLFGQLLFWLLLNLTLIVALFFALPGRGALGWNALLTDAVRTRLLAIGAEVGAALAEAPRAQWPTILGDAGRRYGVQLEPSESRGQPPGPPPDRSFGGDGPPPHPGFAGPLRDRPGDGPDQRRPPDAGAPAEGPPPDAQHERGPPPGLAALIRLRLRRAFGPFEISIPSSLASHGAPGRSIELIATVDSIGALLGFLGIAEWLRLIVATLVLSALLWWPFVGGITRAIGLLTRTTQRIADGAFDARVALRRSDELGALAASVNRMAERIEDHLGAQRQFVADIAHEVTSPLARLQMALALLEARLPDEARAAFADASDEAAQMAALLDELLLFSRAGLAAAPREQAPVELDALIIRVLGREDGARRIATWLPPGLTVRVPAPLLERALANLVRNALRHAGDAMIEVAAENTADGLRVTVRDRGPGVPAEALRRLGEPFYRPDTARGRETGGYGLGLAIARRCVAACGGRLLLGNRDGGGFQAEILLPH